MKKSLIWGGACSAVVVLFYLTLSPYLMNGFWGDDCVNSSIAGMTARTGQSVWDIAWNASEHWMRIEGRFFPLAFLIGDHGHYFFQAVECFRFYQTTLTLTHISIFAWLVFELTGNMRFAGFVAIVLPIFFQIREYHDPIGAYGGLCQYIGIYLAGSALLLAKFCRTNRTWQLILSSLLYGAGLLQYELTLIALPLLWLVVPRRASIRRRYSAFWPFILLTGLYLVTVLWLRHAAGGGAYPGTTPSLDWKKWYVTFGRQLFATVPFSYWTAIWHNNLNVEAIVRQTFGSWSGWLVFGGNLILLGMLLPRRATFYQVGFRLRRGWQLFGVGLVLLVCPAAMIAVSMKYQSEVVRGIGYLPVYISYFGMALLAALGLFWLMARMSSLSNRFTRTMLRSIVIGASVLAAGNRTVNIAVAKRMDTAYKSPRDLIEAAAQVGVFNRMTNGDSLLLTHSPQWITKDFLFQHTKRAINPVILRRSNRAEIERLLTTHRERVFLLDYRALSETDRGWLMLTRINTEGLNSSRFSHLTCKFPSIDYSLFVKSDREFPAVQKGDVRLAQVAMKETNILRRIYAATRAPRYFALGTAVGAGLTPCPDGSGELEAALP